VLGGGTVTSGAYLLRATVGQSATGPVGNLAPNSGLCVGFWCGVGQVVHGGGLFAAGSQIEVSAMRRKGWLIVEMVLWVVLCTACGAKADYDIRGTCDYTRVLEDSSTYDIGTITFSGESGKGTYLQVNIYTVEYEGEFTVKGAESKLTGNETWQGTLANADEMSGAWAHQGEARGTWTVVRENP